MGRNWTSPTDAEIDVQIAEARRRGEEADRTEPRAESARYNAESGRVEVELRNGCLFAFPAEFGQGLRGASPEQLRGVEVTAHGFGLSWPALDVDMAVPALVQGVFGSRPWMSEIAAELGRAGGRQTSEAKTAAARENGRKGGRPRKVRDEEGSEDASSARGAGGRSS